LANSGFGFIQRSGCPTKPYAKEEFVRGYFIARDANSDLPFAVYDHPGTGNGISRAGWSGG